MNIVFIGLLYYCLLISSNGKKEKEDELHVSGNKKPAVSGNIIKEVLYKWFNLLFCFYL